MSKLQKARSALRYARPYLSKLFWSMIFVENHEIKTLGVDENWRCYYNPKFVDSLSDKEVVGVLLHEIYHLMNDHVSFKPLDEQLKRKWNCATDIRINEDIASEEDFVRGAIALPNNVLRADQFDFPKDLFAEKYYFMLTDKQMEGVGGGVANGECGSCVGVGGEWEDGKTTDGEYIPGQSNSHRQITLRDCAKDIVKNIGNVPSHLKRTAECILKPQVRWEQELKKEVLNGIGWVKGRVDYTFKGLSRRQHPQIILPTMIAKIPKVIMVIDSSGSMSTEELSKGLAEVEGVIQSTGSELEVICWDCELHSSVKVHSATQVEITGGGGTDMAEALRFVAEEKRPDICVVFTDGGTEWPGEEFYFKTIICCTTNARCPKWAQTIYVE